MRVHKYRGWDGATMHENVSVIGGKAIRQYYHGTAWTDEAQAGEPLQSTGTADQNGAEIYEGDILSCPTGTLTEIGSRETQPDGSFKIYYISTPNVNYVVSSQGYAFFLGTTDNPKYAGVLNHGSNRMSFDVAIIGNIHQNPELLEQAS